MKFIKEFIFFATLPIAFAFFCLSLGGAILAIPPLVFCGVVMYAANPFRSDYTNLHNLVEEYHDNRSITVVMNVQEPKRMLDSN